MTPTQIAQLAQSNAIDYAHEVWETNPAGHDEAAKWCDSADNGQLDHYGLPDNGIHAIPATLTATWSLEQIDEYEAIFVQTFQNRITELCRELLNNNPTR